MPESFARRGEQGRKKRIPPLLVHIAVSVNVFSIFSQEPQENVRTSTPSLSGAIVSALIGLPFVGIGLIMVWSGLKLALGLRTGDPVTITLIFIGVIPLGFGGRVFWWPAYEQFRQWHLYGTSYLQLESAPVPLGSSVRARLRASISVDDQPPNGFQVRVAAILGSADEKEVVWENRTSLRGQPGANETEVPFLFDLPDDQGRTAMNIVPWISSPADLNWTVEITASFEEKPDYEASFDLPVSVPEDREERTSDDASRNGSISSSESAEPDKETPSVDNPDEYWDVGDGDETDLHHAEPATDPSGGEEEVFSEPVTDRIEMEEGPGHRLSVSFSPATPWVRTLLVAWTPFLLTLVPSLFGAVGLLSISWASVFVPLVLAPFLIIALCALPGAVLYWFWTRWAHTATVTVENGAVTLTNTPLFANGSTTTIPCEALEDVHVGIKTRNGNPIYSLSLVQDPSRSTGPRSDQSEIWVAGDLPNGGEVDGVAARIQEAAEQQASSA